MLRTGHDRVIHVVQSGGVNFAQLTASPSSDDTRAPSFARNKQSAGQWQLLRRGPQTA